MASESIVLYDIPSNERINKVPWSPNTWKARYVVQTLSTQTNTEN